MKLLIRAVAAGLLVWLFSSSALAESTVYMLAKLNIQGTTYTQVVFFTDKDITTVEACEKEVMYGRTGQWQHYGHLVNKVAGMSIAVNYLCRSSSQSFSSWQPHDRYDTIYRVDIREGVMKLVEHDTYAECVGFFSKNHIQETHEYFCAKSNQKIVTP